MTKPKFAIRDLLWLMVVLGLALGWVVDHRRLQQRITEIQWAWLSSIPGPEPKPELRMEMLEKENELLRAELAAAKRIDN